MPSKLTFNRQIKKHVPNSLQIREQKQKVT